MKKQNSLQQMAFWDNFDTLTYATLVSHKKSGIVRINIPRYASFLSERIRLEKQSK